MRKLMTVIALAGALGLGASQAGYAAPVAGFEGLYASVIAACTAGTGSAAACEAAINAYSSALVSARIAPDVALASFTALRSEIAAANSVDTAFLNQIDGLFEELLPESGAVDSGASPTTP